MDFFVPLLSLNSTLLFSTEIHKTQVKFASKRFFGGVSGKKKPSPPLWGWAEFLLVVRVKRGAGESRTRVQIRKHRTVYMLSHQLGFRPIYAG